MNQFQESLRELMSVNNLKPYQLAKKLNMPPSTLNGYLKTKYYPTIEIAITISKFFNCSLDYLFGLADEERHKNNPYNQNPFFENLSKLIKDNGLAISKALSDLKMSETNYYRWRSGKFPKTSNLIDIAKYFNVSLDYLIGDMYK